MMTHFFTWYTAQNYGSVVATLQRRWLLSRGIGSTSFPFPADTLSMSAQGVSVYWKLGVDKGRDCGGTISRGGRQKEKIYKKACGGNYHTLLVAGVKARMRPSPGFLTYCYWSLLQFSMITLWLCWICQFWLLWLFTGQLFPSVRMRSLLCPRWWSHRELLWFCAGYRGRVRESEQGTEAHPSEGVRALISPV